MHPNTGTFTTIDEYIALFPEDVQEKLRKMRSVIKAAAPQAAERISYRMPAFTLNGILVYFAAFTSHISFFPTSSGVAKFKEELAGYESSKGTIRFPLDKPIPYDLIGRITTFRVQENIGKSPKRSK